MPIKSVTSERAETWKANKRVVVVKRDDAAYIFEWCYVMFIFIAAVNLMASDYLYLYNVVLATFSFIGAAFCRNFMFQELRGCNL